MFGIEVCVLHNLGVANWCKFHNLYCSDFRYLVYKEDCWVNIQGQKPPKIVDSTFVT